MVSIDVKSLLLLFALCNLFIFFFFSIYVLFYKEQNQLFRLLIISKLMMSLVWLLFYYRGEIDDAFSIYLANVFLLFATCYEVYYVIYAIEPFDKSRFLRFSIVPIVLSIIFLFNVGQPESIRITIISVLSGFLYFFGGLQLFRQQNATRIQTLVSYYYLVMAAFFLIKPIFSNRLELLSSESFLHLTAFTLGFLTSFLSAMFLLVIQKEADQREIDEKHQQLEKAFESRNKFFSLVAHDLRSPLSSVVQGMQLLKSELLDHDQKRRKEMIELIANRLNETYKFTDNLLKWALSEKGMIKPYKEQVTLIDLIGHDLELMKSEAEAKKIDLKMEVDEKLQLFIDKDMFSTVTRNLLSNAIKFTPEGGEISIFDEKDEDQKKIKIHVKDNGVGIPETKLSELFTLDSAFNTAGTNKETGSGFGLKLCAELIRKLDGKVFARSNKDVGSTFTIEIPA